MVGVDDRARAGAARRAAPRAGPVAPAFAVWVWRTSGRRCRMIRRRARIAAASARGESSRCSAGSSDHGDAELVRDVLHRLLAGGQRARDDDDVVAAPLLLAGELEHVQRGAADVQARDHVDDREAHAVSLRLGAGACRGDAERQPEERGERRAAEERRARERAGDRRRASAAGT